MKGNLIVNFVYIAIICGLVFYIVRVKRELRNIAKRIDESKGQYINIRTRAVDNDVEELVTKINNLYDEAQKINAKNRSIEEELRRSIANMSHDLRTPLTSIMGYIQLIKSDSCTEEEKRDFMDIVERRTKTLQSLIKSFYELSRLEGNEYKFNYKKVNLKNILCDNIATYYNDIVRKDIEPIIEIDDNISDIISDEGAVNRVFSNLIGNMIKHGEDNIKITLKEENQCIVSEFINGSRNMNDEEVSKLFERFYTADKSRNDRNTGLGLAITKAFVEGLGNEIEGKLIDSDLVITIRWNKN